MQHRVVRKPWAEKCAPLGSAQAPPFGCEPGRVLESDYAASRLHGSGLPRKRGAPDPGREGSLPHQPRRDVKRNRCNKSAAHKGWSPDLGRGP